MGLFTDQYNWIQKTRETLFQYCESLPEEDYVKELESFGGDSIRNLHAHVAECYQIWLGKRALELELSEVDAKQIRSVHKMRELFRQTDEMIYTFLSTYEDKWEASIRLNLRDGSSLDLTALWLYTHTTTHEFHHKGQIVKLGRQLGYTPPDTDLVTR
ncbi:DinB family protein [Alkalicoccobacillus porphyridii]|uniref:DUF664 domain-containing protein n=1 Tax=Alkalicoccobacillus porphyridii TaxID=2597270 RepID=A0A553ZWY3_9BACI|nr:DinB family protein [Alkalicoccobacillus porphyridii]TSB45953.1 DUF664 domain-containing protein [Alkalicoccobacillus porphyridii]